MRGNKDTINQGRKEENRSKIKGNTVELQSSNTNKVYIFNMKVRIQRSVHLKRSLYNHVLCSHWRGFVCSY